MARKLTGLETINMEALLSKNPYSEIDMKYAADLIMKMLKWVPKERLTAAEAMSHPFLSGTSLTRSSS